MTGKSACAAPLLIALGVIAALAAGYSPLGACPYGEYPADRTTKKKQVL